MALKYGVIYQGKYQKRAIKRKWTEREYNAKKDDDVAHKDVKIFCNKNQFPSLPFFGPQKKPHGIRALSKHYLL